MKAHIVVFVFLALYVPFTQSIAEDDCSVPTPVRFETLFLDSEKIYFTYPSLDHSSLVLWYLDDTGAHETELMFLPSTTLRLNPIGSHIATIEYENEFYLYGDEVYEGRGSVINSINVINTSTMSVSNVVIPEELHNVPFIRRMIWIDNERILILSRTEYHITGIINILTGEFEILDWLDIMPQPLDSWTFPYTDVGGGLMTASPSGDYLYYTLADPYLQSIHWSISSEFNVLPWTIIDWNGEEVLDYSGGVGFFTNWFDEESIITLDADSNNLLRISLDGTVQWLTEDTTAFYYRYLASPSGMQVALTRQVDERDGLHQEQLAILDIPNGEIVHYCVSGVRIGKEMWSENGRFLVYVARSISDSLGGTDIFVLDTLEDHQISVLPERVENAAIGSRFIRVVGISD